MSVLFAYPGQGAQRPGMLAALPDEPPVRACLEQAADCLGQAPAELESAEALRPSHCALLDEPAARLAEAFAGIRLHRPRVPYLSSSRARLVAEPAALADDLAGNMARRVEWLATLRSAYERGARLHLELPPGRVLSGLARPLFGCATPAFEGSRADTLDALLREEEKRTR